MSMIKTVIIEDEPKNLRILKNMIEEFCPEILVIGEAANSKEGVSAINQYNPQLIFLDIEMPYGNGFDMLNELMPINFEVIFVTAFDKYMLQAFKYSALDYLLKPVNIQELKTAVQNAQTRIKRNTANEHLSILLENIRRPQTSLQKIAIPTDDGFDFIPVAEIIRCEAKGPYTVIYLDKKNKAVVTKPLKEYEDLLPEDIFFRLHNSHLINLNYVKKYSRGRGGYIELEDGTTIEVAVRRKNDFLKRLGWS